MKTQLMTLLMIGLMAGSAWSEDQTALKDDRAKASYSVGVNMGTQMKREKMDLDLELLLKGIKDAEAGHPLLTEQELREAWREYTQKHRKQLTEKNEVEGQKFLDENKTKPGVITLPSGLQYKILAEGSGESPKSNDVVTVNYRGTLTDGTEFDNSAKRGQPLVRPANMLVKGWTEALQLMKPGAKWQLFIPPNLAYGERGSGMIGPDETLIFDVELISFKPPESTPAPSARLTPAQPVTSDIIKVPSKEELQKGAKIEVIKKEDLEKLQKEQEKKSPAETK